MVKVGAGAQFAFEGLDAIGQFFFHDIYLPGPIAMKLRKPVFLSIEMEEGRSIFRKHDGFLFPVQYFRPAFDHIAVVISRVVKVTSTGYTGSFIRISVCTTSAACVVLREKHISAPGGVAIIVHHADGWLKLVFHPGREVGLPSPEG